MTTSPEKPDRIAPGEPIIQGRPGPVKAPPGEFESLMQGSESLQKGVTAPPPGLSPAEVPPTAVSAQNVQPSLDSVLAQVGSLQDGIGSLQTKLNTKDLRLTNSQKSLLRSKLSSSSTHLRAVNETLGVQPPPAPPTQTDKGPLAKLFGYLSDGQTQLNAAQQRLNDTKGNIQSLTPGELLLMQSKLSQAQQEIEYSSLVVSKAVTALTQLLNTQL